MESLGIIEKIGLSKTALTAIQLGEFLNISPKTIFQWAKQGRIPVLRLGLSLRFDPKATAAWLRARSTGA